MTPEQFLLFADPLPEPTLLLADDGLIYAANRAVEERLGISLSWLQGKRLADVVIESPDEVSHYLRLCCRSRSLVLGAMRLHINGSEEIACRMEGSLICAKKQGAAAVLILRLMPKESAAGQFVALNERIEELGREVQRRKRAEAETRQREEWLQVTLHSIGDGVVVGLANHTILVARDGVERPIDDSAAPIRDESGKMLGVVLIFRDVTDLRRAEHELRSSEARKSAILESALDCIITMDHAGKVVEFNPAAEKTFGYSRGEVVGRELADFIIPPSLRERHRRGMAHYLATGEGPVLGKRLELDLLGYSREEYVGRSIADFHADKDTICDILNRLQEGEELHEYPARLKCKDGSIKEVLINSSALFRDGEFVHTRCFTRDVTEQKQSEEKLRLLADTIPQLAWMATPDGHIFWYNRRWYEYTGTTPEQMEGWGWQSVHDADMLPRVLERWKSSIESGEPFDMVFPLKSAEGQFRPFLTRVNPLKNGDGQVIYWFGTNTDIAELREAREALTASEERLRLALDAGRMGVWDWNIRTGELQWSDSLEPLHGLDPGTFGGTFDDFQQLIHPENREAVNAAVRQALESGGEFYVEFRNLRKNGGSHWIAGSGKAFPGDDGQPLRMIGIGLDVTLRKRAEETAQFLADASAQLAVLVDFDSTLQKVSSLAVPTFADWATVDLAEADGSLRRVSVSHVDPAKVQLAHEIHRRFPPDPAAPQGVWNILRTGKSEIVPEITDELLVRSIKDDEMLGIMRELGLRSYIGVPLTVRGKTLGVITFISAESGYRYDQTDLAVAEDLASRAAIAIENAQLYRELREADQRKDEFLATLAHELRNPLAPIRNGLQVMRLAGNGGEMVEEAGHTLTIDLPPTPISLDADLTRLAQVFSTPS